MGNFDKLIYNIMVRSTSSNPGRPGDRHSPSSSFISKQSQIQFKKIVKDQQELHHLQIIPKRNLKLLFDQLMYVAYLGLFHLQKEEEQHQKWCDTFNDIMKKIKYPGRFQDFMSLIYKHEPKKAFQCVCKKFVGSKYIRRLTDLMRRYKVIKAKKTPLNNADSYWAK